MRLHEINSEWELRFCDPTVIVGKSVITEFMRASEKQNHAVFGVGKQTRRKPISSCRTMLKNMVSEVYSQDPLSMTAECFQGKGWKLASDQFVTIEPAQSTIGELKLEQSLKFLRKKADRQTEEILRLTDELKTNESQKSTLADQIASLRDTNSKLSSSNASINRQLTDFRKKNAELETKNKTLSDGSADLTNKNLTLSRLLWKKEAVISKLQDSLQNIEIHNNTQTKLNDELNSLRQNFIALKSKEDKREREKTELKRTVEALRSMEKQRNEHILFLQERQRRLVTECEKLESLHAEQKEESEEILNQMRSMIQWQSNELAALRSHVSEMKVIGSETSCGLSVYHEEIHKIVKRHVLDSKVCSKVIKQITEVLQQMNQGHNQVLRRALSQQFSTSK